VEQKLIGRIEELKGRKGIYLWMLAGSIHEGWDHYLAERFPVICIGAVFEILPPGSKIWLTSQDDYAEHCAGRMEAQRIMLRYKKLVEEE
jgi:hypothetical protein